ncbi:hypothetical protein [Hymenobacter rubidus]|uniref:hypothetical protein n=1 Tax=Hymenobacter rubidus TaxID=1441626 RepID=UPI00191ED83D|nr:hypothetical protein [Hymenobacter rubidus]
MNLFRQVEGHIVRSLLLDAESVTLGFDAYSIVVYNAYSFSHCEDIGNVPSSTVKQVSINTTEVSFLLTTGCILTVQLDEKSYNGPEALVLYDAKGMALAVWN